MNRICDNYAIMLKNKFNTLNPIIIFYGSNIYNVSSSDLDVCIILENSVDDIKKEKIIKSTINFHKENGLRIDEEIPFQNKLIYTIQEVKEYLNESPFIENGIYVIRDICKTKEFLSSREMKQRLLLNILTTDHKVLFDYDNRVESFEKQAWNIIIDAIINFNKLTEISCTTILENMYKSKYTGAEGEMYLGYKKSNSNKEKHLKENINEYLSQRAINLSTNENPYFPTKKMYSTLGETLNKINTYPSSNSEDVSKVIAQVFGLNCDNILITSGTMEGMDITLKAFDKKKIGYLSPTFWGISYCAKKNKYIENTITMKNTFNYEEKNLSTLSEENDIVYLCNPNNPTLAYLDKKDILKIVSKYPKTLFIIDETILAFDEKYDDRTLNKEVFKYNNIVILYSFSKILSIPGLRVGAVISSKKNIKKISSMKLPFSNNIVAEKVLLDNYEELNKLTNSRKRIKENFEYLRNQLLKRGYINGITMTNGSFILIDFKEKYDTIKLDEYLSTFNVSVITLKNSYPEMDGNYIRVSAGTKKQFDYLIKLLDSFCCTD